MKKRILACILAGLLSATSASAAMMEFTVGDKMFTMLEESGVAAQKDLDAVPFISEEGRTMVPLRAIAESFGADVSWDPDTQTVEILRGETKLELTVGNAEAKVNDETVVLDCAPVIVEDRTMVPLRFIGEALSCQVRYVSATEKILIDDTAPVIVCGDITVTFAEFEALYKFLYEANGEAAKDAGMAGDGYDQIIAQLALQSESNAVWIQSAYPTITLSAEDKVEVKGMFADEIAKFPQEFPGFVALFYERNYITGGAPIIKMIMETEDLEKVYKENYVMAKHILVENIDTAEEVYEKATTGVSFDELVQQYGTDPGMEQNPDGYIFTKGEMVKEFEDATFAANVGEITQPVKTDYGYHIIQRLEIPAFSAEMAEKIAVGIANQKISAMPQPQMVMDQDTLYKNLGIVVNTENK